ncbi:glutamate receptor 2.8-like [Impatiens glandulifera]|uniref:glutamate receptor 2.8-like n=1 Tax=Impatiens glandulifera TaxID=253017 RepID=UPI001FB10C41|nr:glutamate receptor 2.8-like [Impatiens glandulifera]
MRSSNNFSVVLLVLYLCFSGSESQRDVNNSTISFNVGVVLDTTTFVGNIGLTYLEMAHSDFYSAHSSYRTRLVLHVRDSNDQIIDAAAAAVDLLKNVKADAIIGPQKSSQANIVMDLGDRAHVPIISFSATSPSLLRRTPYFIQTAQSDDTQVGAIAAIVKYFQWRGVVIIHEDTEYGTGVVPHLSNALQDFDVRIMYRSIIPLSATDDFILKELYKMMTQQTRVFVVHMSSNIGARLFLKAKEIGMMNEGYAWIITNDMTDLLYSLDSHVIEAMQGVLGVKPLIPMSELNTSMFGLWAYDTLWALAMSAERIGEPKQPAEISNSGNQTGPELLTLPVSQTGPELLKSILEASFQGVGGNFKLDKGQLQPSAYKILNVLGNKEKEVGMWAPGTKDVNDVSLHDIVWPGMSTVIPKGWEFPVSGKRLKIAVPFKDGFTEFVNVVVDPITNRKIVSGYSIDIFDSVMSALPYAVPYDYYPYESMTGVKAGSSYYNDLVNQVYLQNFDAAVGDITITANRSKYVDFTFPYAEGGISMIVPITYEDMNNKWIFLKPLTKELWLTSIAFAIGTGFVVWLLEHRINAAFRGPPSHHVGMILYFPCTSLVFANRERIVSNLARLVVAIWLFVVLIWSSSYTASLSSRLTLQNLKPIVSDVEELKRNGDYVGYEYGSFIANVLKDMKISESKLKDYKSRGECHEALSMGTNNGGISAFFDVVPYNKYFLSKYCDKFTTIGPVYHTDGFGFVFPKGSPLVADVSRSLINIIEGNQLLDLQNKWFGSSTCVGSSNGTPSSGSLTLNSFKGLFIITGTITGLCLVVYLGNYIFQNRSFLVERISDRGSTLWSKFRALGKHFDGRDLKSYPFRTDRVAPSLIEITSDDQFSHVSFNSPRNSNLNEVIISLSHDDAIDAREAVDPNSQDMVVLDLST